MPLIVLFRQQNQTSTIQTELNGNCSVQKPYPDFSRSLNEGAELRDN